MKEESEGPAIEPALVDLWNGFWALHKGRDWMVLTNSAGGGVSISITVPKRIKSSDLREEAKDRGFRGPNRRVFQTIVQRMDDVVHEHLTAEAGRAARRA